VTAEKLVREQLAHIATVAQVSSRYATERHAPSGSEPSTPINANTGKFNPITTTTATAQSANSTSTAAGSNGQRPSVNGHVKDISNSTVQVNGFVANGFETYHPPEDEGEFIEVKKPRTILIRHSNFIVLSLIICYVL
jgi:hypothetical protein